MRLIVWTALGAASLITWRWRSAQRKRQHLVRLGAIQPLCSCWHRVAGLRLHARTSTEAARVDATPVVLVHGFGVSSSYFIPTAERLASRFAVFAPDLPGHGRSDSLLPPPGVKQLAEIALEWMSAAGLERACVVAHSMGCQVAVEMALRSPDRISRLVLIGPTSDPHSRNLAAQFCRLLLGVVYERPSLTYHVFKDYLRMNWRLVPEFHSMLHDPVEKKLPLVAVPTLLVRGENDPVVPQRWLEEAARLLGTRHVIVIPRWGHAVQYSAAPQVVDVIEPFLSADTRSQLVHG